MHRFLRLKNRLDQNLFDSIHPFFLFFDYFVVFKTSLYFLSFGKSCLKSFSFLSQEAQPGPERKKVKNQTEREGFEPSVRKKLVQRISNQPLSTTQPSLPVLCRATSLLALAACFVNEERRGKRHRQGCSESFAYAECCSLKSFAFLWDKKQTPRCKIIIHGS